MLDIDWSWNIFSSHIFLTMCNVHRALRGGHQQQKSENWMMIFRGRLLKKMESKACPVNAGTYMAFRYFISFATVLAANFGSYQSKPMSEVVFEFSHTFSWLGTIWSGCAQMEHIFIQHSCVLETWKGERNPVIKICLWCQIKEFRIQDAIFANASNSLFMSQPRSYLCFNFTPFQNSLVRS